MSDDLISRKATYEAFSDYLNKNFVGEISSQTELNIGEIASVIKSIPVAFNKEKVIKELKTRRDWYDINEQPKNPRDMREICEIRERKGKWIAYNEAIDIVEKGGSE